MARCSYCGSSILFGGVSENDLHFCNETCYQEGVLLSVAGEVPEDLINQAVADVHGGQCPRCGGPGPIDVHTSHTVWSALVMTSWRSRPEVCCRTCGIKSKFGGALISGVAGWWGIPWGLIVTPIQIMRNIFGIFWWPDPSTPSEQLQKIIRINLAAQLLASQTEAPAPAPAATSAPAAVPPPLPPNQAAHP